MKFQVKQFKDYSTMSEPQIERVKDIKCFPNVKLVNLAHAIGLYQTVAYITATDMDEVFRIGNVGTDDPNAVEQILPMYSISVGDVIVDERGNGFVVDRFGFTKFDIEW